MGSGEGTQRKEMPELAMQVAKGDISKKIDEGRGLSWGVIIGVVGGGSPGN